MPQWLKALAAKPDELSLAWNPHGGAGSYKLSSDLRMQVVVCVHIYTK